jgi:hypothetical protein
LYSADFFRGRVIDADGFRLGDVFTAEALYVIPPVGGLIVGGLARLTLPYLTEHVLVKGYRAAIGRVLAVVVTAIDTSYALVGIV